MDPNLRTNGQILLPFQKVTVVTKTKSTNVSKSILITYNLKVRKIRLVKIDYTRSKKSSMPLFLRFNDTLLDFSLNAFETS